MTVDVFVFLLIPRQDSDFVMQPQFEIEFQLLHDPHECFKDADMPRVRLASLFHVCERLAQTEAESSFQKSTARVDVLQESIGVTADGSPCVTQDIGS